MSAFGRIWTDLPVASSHRCLYASGVLRFGRCGTSRSWGTGNHGPEQVVWVSDERSEVEVTTYVVLGVSFMSTFRNPAMVASVLLLAALGTSISPSIASHSEEIFGQGTLTRVRMLVPPIVQLSDCGDDADNTFIRSVVRSGTDTFSGIITGTGNAENRFINNTCVPALQHGEFRTIVSFTDVTVADRRGAAMLEFIGHFQVRAAQVADVNGSPVVVAVTTEAGEMRFLCGTGALQGIRGTGIYDATVIPTVLGIPGRDLRGYSISIHFDDPSDATHLDQGMCRDL